MARIPFLTRDEAPADVAAIYDRQAQATGRVLTTTQLRGHCAALLRGITALQQAQEESDYAPGPLKPLLTLFVSRLNACPH